MAAAITASNPTITAPQPGFVYRLDGGGATSVSATPTLGFRTSGIDFSIFKITLSPQVNRIARAKSQPIYPLRSALP
jgi:hypothetical protein